MTTRLTSGFAALACVLLASCYPYNENPQRKPANKPVEKTVTTAEEQKVKEQRDQMKEQEELAKKEEVKPAPPELTTAPTDSPAPEPTKPSTPEKRDFAFANKVPGKDGFVFSPYNNKVVDVRDIPSGTLVQDPTYPAAEKKYFRVP